MGYIFAHLHAGEEILRRIDYTIRLRRVFNFGTIGPDFLFAEDIETEKLFHDEKAEDFAKYLIAHAGERTIDYALGYATHIYTDIEMYPALMSFAKGSFEEYLRLSLAFDALLAKKVYNVSIEKVNLVSKINVGKNLPEEMETLLKDASLEIYGISNINVNTAYRKFIKFLLLTYDPFLVKRMVYPFIKYVLKFDIYRLTYPVFVRNIPENFYSRVNESLMCGIEKSIKNLPKLIK